MREDGSCVVSCEMMVLEHGRKENRFGGGITSLRIFSTLPTEHTKHNQGKKGKAVHRCRMQCT